MNITTMIMTTTCVNIVLYNLNVSFTCICHFTPRKILWSFWCSCRIFPTQESNWGLLALQEDSLPTELLGKPRNRIAVLKDEKNKRLSVLPIIRVLLRATLTKDSSLGFFHKATHCFSEIKILTALRGHQIGISLNVAPIQFYWTIPWL